MKRMKDRSSFRILKAWMPAVLSAIMLWSCGSPGSPVFDALNDRAYDFRYRNLDSTEHAARQVTDSREADKDAKAEAFNHLAFVSVARMDYNLARRQLDTVNMLTRNQIELAAADVQRMRICQRQAQNKDFYNYREQARRRMKRIGEETDMLTKRQRLRFVYVKSEYEIVTSTYFYYIGLEQKSALALADIDETGDILQDTAQYLNYLYNMGAGGIVTQGTQAEINQREFDDLLACYRLAEECGYPYWEANSLQALSEHLQEKKARGRLIRDNLPDIRFLNTDNVPDSLLAGNFARRALDIFLRYGDVYQTAGAYRTLAKCYWAIGDYAASLDCLYRALENRLIERAPDLVASIREQLSVVYSSIDDKPRSDYNRNIYLDMQEKTRQDRYLESRAEQLDRSVFQLNVMIGAVLFSIVLLVCLLIAFVYLRRHRKNLYSTETLLQPLEQWKKENEQQDLRQREINEELAEEKQLYSLRWEKNMKQHVEQRAKVSVVYGITPFIDRIVNELYLLTTRSDESKERREERYQYILELTDNINRLNNFLTDWIQLRQGKLNLQIVSFRLQPLFDMVAKSRMAFRLKGVTLIVEPTDDVVKADPVLTLFMINTMADNARKFTPDGGKVVIGSRATDDYVEISITDTGRGMNPEEQSRLFTLNVDVAAPHKGETAGDSDEDKRGGRRHGFGLLNCRGIIEKYRKLSPLFNVCLLNVESSPGKGSRFFFRLPKGITRTVAATCLVLSQAWTPLQAATQPTEKPRYKVQTRANRYADKAYYANIRHEYEQALLYSDSAIRVLNDSYRKLQPGGTDTLRSQGSISVMPPEIKWFHKHLKMEYDAILDIRNESAVAALALHRWDAYRYHNKVYTQLYKEMSADNTLGRYVQIMQRSEANKNVAIVILALILFAIFPAYYLLYYRHKVYYRFCYEQVGRINDLLLSPKSAQEKLDIIGSMTDERFPTELRNVVQRIIAALHRSVRSTMKMETDTELAKDELRRVKHENEKLYVSNSVLDNCLSTLKHETMYYPARIRQMLADGKYDFEEIREVAVYYKELYSLLGLQARRQLEGIRMEVRPVQLAEVVGNKYVATFENVNPDITIPAPPVTLTHLYDLLHKHGHTPKAAVTVSPKARRYIECRIHFDGLRLSAGECMQLFTPGNTDNLPYIICRQIVRDIGELSNARGCGIVAEPLAGGGVVVIITLPVYNHREIPE